MAASLPGSLTQVEGDRGTGLGGSGGPVPAQGRTRWGAGHSMVGRSPAPPHVCSVGLGQLLVWEWQSESYVLKQQGHFNSMVSLAYSPDGQYIVTGGDDGKVGLVR